jgi:hypothetical protein
MVVLNRWPVFPRLDQAKPLIKSAKFVQKLSSICTNAIHILHCGIGGSISRRQSFKVAIVKTADAVAIVVLSLPAWLLFFFASGPLDAQATLGVVAVFTALVFDIPGR